MENDEHKELEVICPTGLRINKISWIALDERLVEEIGKLIEENKKLKEKNQAWKQVVDWATECDFNLEQIIQDEDELDNFIEEMDKKGINYLDMFNEYAIKYLKERENNGISSIN